MIIQGSQKRVVQSHDFDEVNCTIDAEDMRYVASLLRNNYSNTSLAVIREITANAVDANKEANSTRKVEVKLPTTMNPTFSVRDYGSGLSQGDVFGLYSKYGKSTKRQSNNYIGAFGIGKFAPLSYGDNFSVVSYYGGERKTYNVYVTEEDDTKISLMESVPSKDPTGLEVQVAVSDSDVQKFRRECLHFFEHFDDDRMPILKGLGEDTLKPLNKTLEGATWFLAKTESSAGYNYNSHNQSHAIMGGVAYPINASNVNFDGVEENVNNNLYNLLSHDGLYINFDLGDLKLHHSRESLEYNKTTQKVLVDKSIEILNELAEIAKEKLAGSNDFWQAKVNYARIINSLPYQVRSILGSQFTWKGHKVDSFAFNQVWDEDKSGYYRHDPDMFINWYVKVDDSDVTDGFKVQNKKESSIYAKDNTLVAINDCDNSSQLALRIRTIFKENPDATDIYVLRFTTDAIKKKFYEDEKFELVDKKFVYSLCNVEKAKVKSSRTATKGSGNTRQAVKLFQFNADNVAYGNSSAWEDVATTPSGDILYVPIFNYKIVDEDSTGSSSVNEEKFSLRQLKDMLFYLEQYDVKIPTIYGVRRKDCKKLEDNYKCALDWIVSEGKKLLERDDVFENELKVLTFKDIRYNDNFSSISNCLNQHLISHSKKSGILPSDHDIHKFYDIVSEENKVDMQSKRFRVIRNFVEEHTNSKEYSDRLAKLSKTQGCELKELFNAIKENYPMLQHMNIYSYRVEVDTMDAIIEYIKMCDHVNSKPSYKLLQKSA